MELKYTPDLQCSENLKSHFTAGCLQNTKLLGNQSVGPYTMHQGQAVSYVVPYFALLWCLVVRPLHSLGSPSCCPGRNLRQHGAIPPNILQLKRVSNKSYLVAALNTPFLGPCGLQSPPLFSKAVPELHEFVWTRYT